MMWVVRVDKSPAFSQKPRACSGLCGTGGSGGRLRVLITGAAGFIGSCIADALFDEGHEIVGIDDLSTGRFTNFPAHAESGPQLVLRDIRNDANVVGFDPEVIYHCAASYKDRADWERDASTNVLGTINVVREAQRTGAKIVYFQTSLCYGQNPISPVSLMSPLDPRGSYATSKTAGEMYIRDSGVPYVSLRLANIYGPRNLSGPVPTFWKRLKEGEPCTVVDSRRDFVYIDDLVEVAMKAAINGRGFYHVASGSDVEIKDIYWSVAGAMGMKPPLDISYVDRGPDDVATILLDPNDTYEEFGWTARTPLVAGIKEAVNWYEANGVTETYTHLATAEEE
jgi:UDP-glucose 4-epimerase